MGKCILRDENGTRICDSWIQSGCGGYCWEHRHHFIPPPQPPVLNDNNGNMGIENNFVGEGGIDGSEAQDAQDDEDINEDSSVMDGDDEIYDAQDEVVGGAGGGGHGGIDNHNEDVTDDIQHPINHSIENGLTNRGRMKISTTLCLVIIVLVPIVMLTRNWLGVQR
jgi:hypothetical protein